MRPGDSLCRGRTMHLGLAATLAILVAPVDARAAADSLAALAQTLQPAIETLRGSRFLRPVPVAIVADSTARRYFTNRLEMYSPAARLEAASEAFAALGLVPPGTDLRARVLDVLEEQAGGYYDPESGTFYVLGDMPRSSVPIIMVHELAHALDDQHFRIDSTLAAVAADDDDAQAAAGAVVEGSGTLVMTAYVAREIGAGRLPQRALEDLQASEAGRAARLRQAPALLRRLLLAPYVLGQSFLLRGHPEQVVSGIVPADVDRAFREPPRSTEQLLHADKYWNPERIDLPRRIAAPALASVLGPGWTQQGTGTLGELLLALLVGGEDPPLDGLDVVLPERWTAPGVAGWGGDRWWLYGNGREACTVLCTVWDDAAAARAFEAALRLPAGCRVERYAAAVSIVGGAPAGRARAILSACRGVAGSPPSSSR